MTAVLTPPLPKYTFADWERLEGRWELIEGIPYAMSPLPVPKHQRIANNISAEFRFALKAGENGKRCKAYQPLDYRLADTTVVEPDLLIVCGDVKKKYLDFRPELVAEVLSPRTAENDRGYKYARYEQERIPYYLIVDIDAETIEVYEIGDGVYKLAATGHAFIHAFMFAGGCTVAVDFGEVWD